MARQVCELSIIYEIIINTNFTVFEIFFVFTELVSKISKV